MSDMLEYSDFGSFYTNSGIREINLPWNWRRSKNSNCWQIFPGRGLRSRRGIRAYTVKNGYRSGR